MEEFVFTIAKADLNALGYIRCLDGIRVAEDGVDCWVRGINSKMLEDAKLRRLPVKQRFTLDKNDHLFVMGKLTPVQKLKELNWQPVAGFIPLELPPSGNPGQAGDPVSIKLIPSTHVQKSIALLTNLKNWKEYADTASAARLNLLRFAVSENEDVLIIGEPLPPLPGKEYWLNNGMLLPCGYDFELPLLGELIKRKLNAEDDSVIVFDVNSDWHKIDRNFFVPAKRSAVRLTKIA